MKSPLQRPLRPPHLRKPLALLSLLLVLALSAGCSSKSNSSPGLYSSQSSYASVTGQDSYDEVAQESEGMAGESDGAAAGSSAAQPKKIVKNARVNLETLQFEQTVDSLARSAEEVGGYVQACELEGESLSSKGRGNRSASFTLRIPAQELESYLLSLAELGNVLSQSQDSQDITDSYYDTQARLNALQAQETRLLELMDQAENLEQLLQIEESLTQVRYQIESLTAAMKRYDADVAYSTVTIQLWEVEEYQEEKPDTFGARIRDAFRRSGESFLDFSEEILSGLIVILPILLIYGGLIALIVVGVVRLRRKKKKSSLTPTAAPPKESGALKSSEEDNTKKG